MAAASGLQAVRDVMLAAYFDDIIEDVEFAVVYEENYSKKLFPYWKYEWTSGTKLNLKSS